APGLRAGCSCLRREGRRREARRRVLRAAHRAATSARLRSQPRGKVEPMLEMVIYGVSFDMVGKRPIVLLKTLAGNRFLPSGIGPPHAAATLMRLQDARPPRPATHDLLCSALDALEAEITQVAITELRDNTFFAEVTISNGVDEHRLDSRPSDALALAVRAEA